MSALRAGLDAAGPGRLLGVVGLLLSIAVTSDDPVEATDSLVEMLRDVALPETTAALLAVATLTGDPDQRRRVRREIADTGQVLPRWLAELDRTAAVDRAVEVSTVLRDADELVVGVSVPGGHPLTAVVHVVNEYGAVATDGYVVESPLDSVVALLAADDDPDVRVRDLPPADARARIAAAIAELELGPGELGTEHWATTRPVVEWMLTLLPPGGDASVLRELSDEDLDEIAEALLSSPWGAAWRDEAVRPLVDEVLAAGSANGIGDPLVWSPDNVVKLLEPDGWHLPRRTPRLDQAPALLRDLIRYGHVERGLRQELTDEALAAVDAATDAFLEGLPLRDGNGA